MNNNSIHKTKKILTTEHRENIRKSLLARNFKHSDASKKQMSESLKESWKNPSEKQLEASLENLPKDTAGSKNANWRGGKISVNCAECGKPYLVNGYRIKLGKTICCSRLCQCIYLRKHCPKSGTSIEIAVEQGLIAEGVPYQKQVALLHRTVADFVVRDNIVVYCDGDYWHSIPSNKERDSKNNDALRQEGYRVLRFSETRIKSDLSGCLSEIQYENI